MDEEAPAPPTVTPELSGVEVFGADVFGTEVVGTDNIFRESPGRIPAAVPDQVAPSSDCAL